MKILLLEDDPILSDLMFDHLSDAGYKVTLCFDGTQAIEMIDSEHFDLFILDINVPHKSGIKVLEDTRQYKKNTPAIFITAYQDIRHLKKAFLAGGDDYIKKPFELEELDHRINNIKKRYNIETDQIRSIDENINFCYQKRELSFDDGTTISLSQKESQILHYFLNNKNRVISSDEIIQNIWQYEEIPSDATLRVYIKNIRRHIGKDHIKTLRGLGYSFES